MVVAVELIDKEFWRILLVILFIYHLDVWGLVWTFLLGFFLASMVLWFCWRLLLLNTQHPSIWNAFFWIYLLVFRDLCVGVDTESSFLYGRLDVRWSVCALLPYSYQLHSGILGSSLLEYSNMLLVWFGLMTKSDALDELQLKRYCCRRMVLTHVDLIEKLLHYNSTYSSSLLSFPSCYIFFSRFCSRSCSCSILFMYIFDKT